MTMKDKYIRPELECIEIVPALLAASFSTDEEAEDDVVAGANKRDPRQWGDFWK